MTAPTPAEIEARAKADYEKRCADLQSFLRTRRQASAELREWGDPEAGEFWDACRAVAREARMKETEYEQ
jgi:hypothetical protein